MQFTTLPQSLARELVFGERAGGILTLLPVESHRKVCVSQPRLLPQCSPSLRPDLLQSVHRAIFDAAPVAVTIAASPALRVNNRQPCSCEREGGIERERAVVQRFRGSVRTALLVITALHIELKSLSVLCRLVQCRCQLRCGNDDCGRQCYCQQQCHMVATSSQPWHHAWSRTKAEGRRRTALDRFDVRSQLLCAVVATGRILLQESQHEILHRPWEIAADRRGRLRFVVQDRV